VDGNRYIGWLQSAKWYQEKSMIEVVKRIYNHRVRQTYRMFVRMLILDDSIDYAVINYDINLFDDKTHPKETASSDDTLLL
jgi:hypothetical protein